MEWVPIALGALIRENCVLLGHRRADAPQGGKWEFPGGKVHPGESLPEAVRRELTEEVGISVAVGPQIAETRYLYPEIAVELHLFLCTSESGEPLPLQVDEVRWVTLAELGNIDFPPANAPLVEALQRFVNRS